MGEVVFSSDDAVARANEGHKVILVRWETNPDDLKGMVAAEGILTSHGGKTSHAAVIARGMGTPCVCGVERFHIDAAEKVVRIEAATACCARAMSSPSTHPGYRRRRRGRPGLCRAHRRPGHHPVLGR